LGKTRLLHEAKHAYLTKGYKVIHYSTTEKTTLLDALRRYLGKQKTDILKAEDKYQIFEEITQDLIESSKQSNIIIEVDDIDALSDYELSLFRYVGYGIRGYPVLLIGTSTPCEKVTNLGFEIITLNQLSEADTVILLRKTLVEINPADRISTDVFAPWLHKQSGGNPLFIVEILKTLYDKEILFYQNNQWQIKAAQLVKVSLPQNIEDLVAPRIEQLPADELKILEILCLTNHPLPPATIDMVLDGQFDIPMEHLKTLGLANEAAVNGSRRIFIASKMIATSVVNKLKDEEKIRLCGKLITAIENTASEDTQYIQVLADLNDIIGNNRKAYMYYQSAAANAEEIYDYDAALRCYGKVADYAEKIDNKQLALFHIKLGDLNQRLGDNETASSYYNKVLTERDKDLSAEAYVGLGKIEAINGEFDRAIAYYRRALRSVKTNSSNYIDIGILLGYALTNLSKYDEALSIFQETLELARKLSDYKKEAATLYAITSVEWYRCDYSNGIRQAEDLLRYCKRHKLASEVPLTANLLGLLYRQMKNTSTAHNYFKSAIDDFTRIKRVDALCAALHNSAQLLTQLGRYDEATQIFEKTLKIAQQTNNRSIQIVSMTNLAIINSTFGKYEKAIELYDSVLEIDNSYVWAVYGKAMVLLEKREVDEAVKLLTISAKDKKGILYAIGQAAISCVDGDASRVTKSLEKALESLSRQKPDISIQIESLAKASCLYHEIRDFKNSRKLTRRILDIVPEDSREYSIAHAILKISNYILNKTNKIDIEREIAKLKEIGCLYDYAYLKRLQIEAMIDRGTKQDNVRGIVEELNNAQEVFESVGAEMELNKIRKLQSKLFPLIVEDYSRRIISEQYLETFSGIAELISSGLGDEDFVQNILDLVIKATNAERGALFIKSTRGMDFIAGRDMDKTTIKDASELSRTAFKQMEKGKILFTLDALADPSFSIKKSVMLNQIRSLLCIPLSVSGNVIGAVYLDSRIASGIFGPQDKEFLMTISKILASVIEKSIAFRSMSEENILLKTNIIKEIGSGHLMGKSRVMKEVYRLIDSVAETNSPVLILGETGTGKGMIARLIHLRSRRKSKKFLSINCGTIPETLLESELFGHKKGAFTGAISDKKGLLEEGEGGTVFLDEITNTSPEFQGKLLEAIEEKIIRRVGETTTRTIDVRFLFATNKDLEIEVEDSRFRRDLFYRINVFKIEVPPLRDRPNDIPLLAQFFLERYTREINKKIDGFIPEAMQRLREYFWPGNVRELQNVIERAVVLAKSKLINSQDIGFEKTKTAEVMPLKEIKREAVIEALNMANWNVTKAAKLLGIGRRSLHRYIKKFNIANNSTLSIGRKS